MIKMMRKRELMTKKFEMWARPMVTSLNVWETNFIYGSVIASLRFSRLWNAPTMK